jgi:hypothetical protein
MLSETSYLQLKNLKQLSKTPLMMKTNRAGALRQETSLFKPKNGVYTAPFPYAAALIAAIYFLSPNHLPVL